MKSTSDWTRFSLVSPPGSLLHSRVTFSDCLTSKPLRRTPDFCMLMIAPRLEKWKISTLHKRAPFSGSEDVVNVSVVLSS